MPPFALAVSARPPSPKLRRTARALALALAIAFALFGVPVPPSAAATGYDYGDAPAEIDAATGDPARALISGPRLGTSVSADRADPDTGSSTKASESADGDDDDALASLAPLPVGRLTTLRLEIPVSRVDVPARLCGWLDLDLDRAFRTSERICVDVPVDAGSAVLRWDGRVPVAGAGLVRLRIATAAREAERPDGPSGSGEIEDHPITFDVADPPARPALSLETLATPTRVERAGESVRYTYRVRNRGGLTLRDVTLADARVPSDHLDCVPALGATLTAGARLTCTATVAVTQDDLDFGALETAAEARAEAPAGDPEDQSDDVLAVGPATVEVRARSQLGVLLTTAPRRPGVGDRVTASVAVTNTGNVTLTNVRPDAFRPRLADLACTPGRTARLAPGARLLCTGSFVVPADDARRGRMAVRVGARAERPYGTAETTRDDVVGRTSLEVPLNRSAMSEPDPDPVPDREPGSRPGTPAPAGGLADTGGPGSVPASAGLLALLVGIAALARGASRRR